MGPVRLRRRVVAGLGVAALLTVPLAAFAAPDWVPPGPDRVSTTRFPGWLWSPAAWTPRRGAAMLTYVTDPELGPGLRQVDVVTTAGRAYRLPLPEGAAELALPSPDGTKIAFGTPDAVIVRSATGDVRLPVSRRGEWVTRPLAWTADGTGVYYLPGRLSDQRWADRIPFRPDDDAGGPIGVVGLDGTERTLPRSTGADSLALGPGADEVTVWGVAGVRVLDARTGVTRRTISSAPQAMQGFSVRGGASPNSVITLDDLVPSARRATPSSTRPAQLQVRDVTGRVRHRVSFAAGESVDGIGFLYGHRYLAVVLGPEEHRHRLVTVNVTTGEVRTVSAWTDTNIGGGITASTGTLRALSGILDAAR